MKEKVSMILSMVIFGTIGIFVEYIAMPSGVIASVRGIVGVVLIMTATILSESRKKEKAELNT